MIANRERTGAGKPLYQTAKVTRLNGAERQPAIDGRAVGSTTTRGPRPRVPRATYRIQFHKGFTFRDAERLIPYLAGLGISHLYASPIFHANPGSMHGYDVVDYSSLNPELGDLADFRRLCKKLCQHDMGLVLDFVPNHMGIASGRNQWWQDVLENGQSSEYASYFDIDWQPIKPELENQVLLPFLGDHYGVVLENGELELRMAEGSFTLWYYDLPLPIAPPTYPMILKRGLEPLIASIDPDDLGLLEFQSICSSFERLAAQNETDPDRIAERMREQRLAKLRLAAVCDSDPRINEALSAAIAGMNGRAGDPRSFDALDDLIAHQSFRLSFWRVAAEEINYRRFFAINELAAIRQEHPPVFERTHSLLMRLLAEAPIDAIRIDHPDGLWDPAVYFRNLQQAAMSAKALDATTNDSTDVGREARSIYLYVEKILEPGEELPRDWQVDGTVGYEFMQSVSALFVDALNRKVFDDLYQRFTGQTERFDDAVYQKKKLIMRVALASEINVLARTLDRLSEQHRRTRDFTFHGLRYAMREVIACFPTYRTYLDEGTERVGGQSRTAIERAIREAIKRNPASDRDVFDFLRSVLLFTSTDDLTPVQRSEHIQFVMKFQQITGPVMAKGLEDTAFYTYLRLTSLNEVGGDPAAFGISVEELHKRNRARFDAWPRAMLASSTHDTKRGEDVRARINALSEMPKPWRQGLNRWARINRKFKMKVDGQLAPSRNDEYLFYQTLIGAWPRALEQPDASFLDRIESYMTKAIHEAQVHTSWINPNSEYDSATREFVRRSLSRENSQFLADFANIRERTAEIGAMNALSQQFLKLTAPGVPDIYQGTEFWDYSLVDPDNRRLVDFDLRRRELSRIRRQEPSRKLAADLLEHWNDGRIKLYLTHHVLNVRKARPELFEAGDYRPLEAIGPEADHVVAFERRLGDLRIVAVAPRLIAGLTSDVHPFPLGDVWSDTRIELIPDSRVGSFQSTFTGERVRTDDQGFLRLADLLSAFPVALLQQLPR